MVGVCALSFMGFSVRLVHVIKRAIAKVILSFPIARLDWEDGFFVYGGFATKQMKNIHKPPHIFLSALFLLLCHIITTQCPALVLPSRTRTPFFCRAERSRHIVRGTTDKTTDICSPEMKGFSLINLHIFFCLSDSCTTDKLPTSLLTELLTELLTFFLPLVTSNPRWNVTSVPPQCDSTVGIGSPAFSNPSCIFL